MIEVWLLDLAAVAAVDEGFFIGCLGDGERGRLARFIRAERRAQFLAGRLLLRLATARLLQLPASDITLQERPSQSPLMRLKDPDRSAPFFSISHSRHWACCAVSKDTPIGIDLEFREQARDFTALAASAFSAPEQRWLAQQPDRAAAFYRVWSAKEALFKYRSNAAHAGALPELVDPQGRLQPWGDTWAISELAHPHCAWALCSAAAVPAFKLQRLAALDRTCWQAALGPSYGADKHD